MLVFSPGSGVLGVLHTSQVSLLTSAARGVIGAAAGEAAEARQAQVRAAAVVGAVVVG